jgi:hypothetical protein
LHPAAARWRWLLALAACLAAAGFASVHARLDVNWDLKNYHFYNAWAFLNARLGWDIAPAQLQTYYNPLLDLPFYFLVQAIPSPRIIAFVMAAATTGVAAFALLRMLALLFPKGTHDRAVWIACAFAVGVTGSMGRSVIGATMNEWPPAMMLMVSLAVLVASIAKHGRPSLFAIGVAGLVVGIAVGLKLTYGVFGIALIAAAAVAGTMRERARDAFAMSAFLFAGFLLSYGLWGAILWDHFANPFFPHFNGIFKSPWWKPVNYFDPNYGPRTAFQAIFFPLILAQEYKLVSEVSFRDWRLGTLFVVAILVAIRFFLRRRVDRPAAPWIFLAAFTLASYLLWLKLFGIYRYLVPLEMLAGPLIVGGALYLIPATWTWPRRFAIALVAILLIGSTRDASWGRLPFRGAYFDVAVPDVAPRSLVILGPYQPMAYALPFFRPDTRFVSPANNFLHPSQDNLLTRQVREVIAKHPGPIYSLDFWTEDSVKGSLEPYGLARDESSCLPLRSYLDTSAMRVCRVHRIKP